MTYQLILRTMETIVLGIVLFIFLRSICFDDKVL